MASSTEQRRLEPREAADYIGMSEGALRRLIRDGAVPISKPGGRPKSRIRIARADLDAPMAASRVEATSGPLAKGGTSLGTFVIGEVRTKRLEIVGPGLIAPAHADKVTALQDRYGIDLESIALDTDKDRSLVQMKKCFAERFEDHLAAHPPKPSGPLPYEAPE